MSEKLAIDILRKGLKKYGELEVAGGDIRDLLNKHSITDSYNMNRVSLQMLSEAIIRNGEILERNEEEQYCIAVVKTGFLRMATALIAATIVDGTVWIAAYAREGLIKQQLCKKAMDSIKNAL